MNNIYIRQNDIEILDMLFLQRKMYDSAKIYWRLGWCIAITLAMVNIVCQILDIDSDIIILVVAAMDLGIILFEFLADRSQKIGAVTKGYIDDILFGMNNTYDEYSLSRIRELVIIYKGKYPKQYQVQINNTGKDDPPGIRDWYIVAQGDNKNIIVYKCQKQNVWWNGKLSRLYLYTLISIIGFLAVIFLLALSVLNISIKSVALMYFANLGIVVKALKDVISGYRYYSYYTKANEDIIMIDKTLDESIITNSQINMLQGNINKIRKIQFLVPDFLHKLMSKKYHKLYCDANLQEMK